MVVRSSLARLSAVLLAALPVARVHAGPRAVPCPGGRFLVARNVLVPGDPSSDLEAISIDPLVATISVGCPGVVPRLVPSGRGTRLRAVWPECVGLLTRRGRPARTKMVRALIAAPDCETLAGTLIVGKGTPKRRLFVATRSHCGDGYVDAGNDEQCESDLDCAPGVACSTACLCESPTTTSTSLAPSTTVVGSSSSSTSSTSSSSSTTATTPSSSTSSSSSSSTSTSLAPSTTIVTSSSSSTSSTSSSSSSSTSSTTSTSTSTSSSTSSSIPGGEFACTEILAFSQTLTWANTAEFEQHIDGGRWQMRFRSGGDIDLWSNPNADAWTAPVRTECTGSPVLCTPCAQSANAPDRVIITITLQDYESNVQVWAQKIRNAVATIRLRHPQVRQIVLQTIVGGPDHALCPFPGDPIGVRASYNHPYIDAAIAQVVVDAPDLVAGISPEVAACADYLDDVGHLQPAVWGPIGNAIGQYYENAGG